MDPKDIAIRVLDTVKKRWTDTGEELSEEILVKIQSLLEAMGDLYLRELAGEDVTQLKQIVEARIQILKAAGAIRLARDATDTFRDILLGAVKVAFSFVL